MPKYGAETLHLAEPVPSAVAMPMKGSCGRGCWVWKKEEGLSAVSGLEVGSMLSDDSDLADDSIACFNEAARCRNTYIF